jgi:tryptophan-rich sensory protein
MLVLTVIMLFVFRKINVCAVWLNVPYLIWTIFAAYLTIGAYILNS